MFWRPRSLTTGVPNTWSPKMGTAQAAETTFEMVGMPVPVFKVGPPSRPKIVHDDGHLGKFAPRKATAADVDELRKMDRTP